MPNAPSADVSESATDPRPRESARPVGRDAVRGGGALRNVSDHNVIIPTDRTDRAQEFHLCVEHLIGDFIEAGL